MSSEFPWARPGTFNATSLPKLSRILQPERSCLCQECDANAFRDRLKSFGRGHHIPLVLIRNALFCSTPRNHFMQHRMDLAIKDDPSAAPQVLKTRDIFGRWKMILEKGETERSLCNLYHRSFKMAERVGFDSCIESKATYH